MLELCGTASVRYLFKFGGSKEVQKKEATHKKCFFRLNSKINDACLERSGINGSITLLSVVQHDTIQDKACVADFRQWRWRGLFLCLRAAPRIEEGGDQCTRPTVQSAQLMERNFRGTTQAVSAFSVALWPRGLMQFTLITAHMPSKWRLSHTMTHAYGVI